MKRLSCLRGLLGLMTLVLMVLTLATTVRQALATQTPCPTCNPGGCPQCSSAADFFYSKNTTVANTNAANGTEPTCPQDKAFNPSIYRKQNSNGYVLCVTWGDLTVQYDSANINGPYTLSTVQGNPQNIGATVSIDTTSGFKVTVLGVNGWKIEQNLGSDGNPLAAATPADLGAPTGPMILLADLDPTSPNVVVTDENGVEVINGKPGAPSVPMGQDVEEGTLENYTFPDAGDGTSVAASSFSAQLSGTPVTQRFRYESKDTTGLLRRKRFTDVSFAADGSKRLATTIYGYYPSTATGGRPGKLWFVVDPAGVNRYLAANGQEKGVSNTLVFPTSQDATCPLNSLAQVKDQNGTGEAETVGLLHFATTVYDYANDGKLQSVASGCASCSGGTTSYEYGTGYRHITAADGRRTVEFYDTDGRVQYSVLQLMSGTTISQTFLTHNLYTNGQLVEQRSPTACAGYTLTTSGGWVTNVTPASSSTSGLVRTYGYETTGELQWEKVQQGFGTSPAPTAYWIRYNEYGTAGTTNYNGVTIKRVTREVVYDTEVSGDTAPSGTETLHNYQYYQDGGVNTHAVEFHAIMAPGASSPTTIYHYKQDTTTGLYYNDWTRRANGSLDFTYQVDPAGYPQLTVRDVSTGTGGNYGFVDNAGTSISYPVPTYSASAPWGTGSWATTTGASLLTRSYYDDRGRVASTVGPDNVQTSYLYQRLETTASGRTTTTALATLTARRPSGGNYGAEPVSISFSTPDGHSLGSARGVVASTTSDLASAWSSTATDLVELQSAFKGTKLIAWTHNNYSDGGQLSSTDRYCQIPSSGFGTNGTDFYRTSYSYDSAGRLNQTTDANGHNTFKTYGVVTIGSNTYTEARTYPHIKSDNSLVGLIQVTWTDGEGRTFRGFSATATMAGTTPTGTETLSERSRTTYGYDWRGRLLTTWSYFDLGSLAQDQDGAKNTNYYETTVRAYDNQDRPLRTMDGSGLIRATVYNGRGQVTSQWQGTDDTGATATDPSNAGANDLKKVAYAYYDTNKDGTGTLTDQVTRQYTVAPASSLTYTYTDYEYDSALRQTWSKPEVGPWSKQVFDTSGRPSAQETYQNGSTSTLLAKTTVGYDALSRPNSNRTWEVSSGATTGNYLESTTSYGETGRAYKVTSPKGGFTKWDYNVLGQSIHQYVCSAEGTPGTITGDTVVSQSDLVYDPVGNVIQQTSYARYHDDTSTTGALTSSSARPSYVCTWYDEVDRVLTTANYGTNGGSTFSRPSTPPSPNSADTVIVSATAYDDANRWVEMTDNKGQVIRKVFDPLGRTLTVIENYTNGTVTDSTNRTTTYTYNANDQVLTQTAVYPTSTPSKDQTTSYTYGTAGSPVPSTSLLATIAYPSPDGSVTMTYYANGQLATRTDQRSITLTYTYDNAGRMTSQYVSAGTVSGDQKIAYTYTDLGKPERITRYRDTATPPTLRNDVLLTYNDLGMLTGDYQAHTAAATTGSLGVQYAYDTTTTSTADGHLYTKGLRRKSMTYPNGRILRYEYSTGLDDTISRVSFLADDNAGAVGQILVSFSRLGDGTLVTTDDPQPQVKLNYAGTSAGSYPGLDQFGRIANHTWTNYNTSTSLDSFGYGYDRNSNRLYKANGINAAQSELYHANGSSNGYDGLDRLTAFARGTLNAAKDTITDSTIARGQAWTLDVLGNMASTDSTTAGTTTTETRAHNQVNQITSVNSSAVGWYDAAGNTIQDYTGSAHGRQYVYDAWNQIVTIKDEQGHQLVDYYYDGLGRRTKESPLTGVTDYYYSAQWQVVEERAPASSDAIRKQYVWGLDYVDQLVLRDADADLDATTGTLGNNGAGTTTTGLEQRLYALQDANYNVTAIVDTTGSVAERFLYDPYGNPSFCSDSWAAKSASDYDWVYLHQGGRYVPTRTPNGFVSSLYHFRNRDLHPQLMRWMQTDPLGYVDGTNMYHYEGTRPSCGTDPTGLAFEKITPPKPESYGELVSDIDHLPTDFYAGAKYGHLNVSYDPENDKAVLDWCTTYDTVALGKPKKTGKEQVIGLRTGPVKKDQWSVTTEVKKEGGFLGFGGAYYTYITATHGDTFNLWLVTFEGWDPNCKCDWQKGWGWASNVTFWKPVKKQKVGEILVPDEIWQQKLLGRVVPFDMDEFKKALIEKGVDYLKGLATGG